VLHRERHRFLSRKVQQSYLGYAMAQLKKIKTHRAWLLHPPAHKPTREEFGLPSASTLSRDDRHRIERTLAEKVRGYGLDSIEMPKTVRIALQERLHAFWCDTLAAHEEDLPDRLRAVALSTLPLPEGIVATLEAERRYQAAMKHWEAYQAWKTERNPARAALEQRHGYDTKHAMHLVRLMQTGLELLQTGELHVRRADAESLQAIRDGALSFETLLARASELEAQMHEAARDSALPEQIDFAFVNDLALELMRGA
jgi:predicted nucleotidyltransferase